MSALTGLSGLSGLSGVAGGGIPTGAIVDENGNPIYDPATGEIIVDPSGAGVSLPSLSELPDDDPDVPIGAEVLLNFIRISYPGAWYLDFRVETSLQGILTDLTAVPVATINSGLAAGDYNFTAIEGEDVITLRVRRTGRTDWDDTGSYTIIGT